MIDEIQVRSVASISNASIDPDAAMTVITGETGAGKTALLSALKLMMGQRVGREAVKDGASEAEASGHVILRSIPEALKPIIGLEDGAQALGGAHGTYMTGDDEEAYDLVVSRKMSSEGRSRVRIDGRMASVTELSEAIAPSIGLSSQHDQVLLAKPQTQRDHLDAWAQTGEDGLLEGYRVAFERVSEAKRELEEVEKATQRSVAEVEEARFRLSKIDAISPDPSDYDELIANVRKAENIEMLARTTGEAKSSLSDEGGVLDGLNAAIVLIEDAARADDQLAQQASALREALYSVEDVARDVAAYNAAIDMDEVMLGAMQERIAAYQSLMRSYGPTIEDVARTAAEARRIVDSAEGSGKMIDEAKRHLRECEEALTASAKRLSSQRKAAASTLEKAVSDNLSRLHMDGAEFVCEVEQLPRSEWSESGPDDIRFKLRPAAAMQPRDLARIASGGELSRTMLALHAALGDRDEVETLVFDEIDAGVGGEAAESVGDLLLELSDSHQVIVVTHLAQIAAKAHRHFVARKSDDEGVINTTISEVSDDARVDEIARMLSGTRTEESLAHARALLSGARTCPV